MPKTKACMEPGCERPKAAGVHRCRWHWLIHQPIETQIRYADMRRELVAGPGRPRVPAAEWPEGERWCAGCQSFVPLFYTSGSRCAACNSRAAHAGHVERTYGLTREEYDALLAWQGGRCFICGNVPRVRRLAVDHDHETGRVRGLLCANDEWGCNRTLARLLGSLEAAQRLLEYVELPPLERMRQGQPSRFPRHGQRKTPEERRRWALGGMADSLMGHGCQPPEVPPDTPPGSIWTCPDCSSTWHVTDTRTIERGPRT